MMTDCRECEHGQTIRHKDRLCDRLPMVVPIEQARDQAGDCGPDGKLFEPKGEGAE